MIFVKFLRFFVTKLLENVGNPAQMFSGSVGDMCDALSHVCTLAGDENLKNPRKVKILRADSLLCLSWVMVDRRLILEIFHDFCEIFEVFCH